MQKITFRRDGRVLVDGHHVGDIRRTAACGYHNPARYIFTAIDGENPGNGISRGEVEINIISAAYRLENSRCSYCGCKATRRNDDRWICEDCYISLAQQAHMED